MRLSFENTVALVTGAGSGIGLATATAFAESGASVVIADYNEEAALVAAADLVSRGHKALGIRCDVTDDGQVEKLLEKAVSEFGRLDSAFNCAGIHVPVVETADADGADFDRAIAVNLRGVWNCMKYELREMRRYGRGAIVNCSSQGGLVGIAGLGAYTASKHAVMGLTKSAALEYAARGIRINAVCPGPIDTPMVANAMSVAPERMKQVIEGVPMKRLGTPEEVASAVLWLCSSGAGFAIGQALVVDGGCTTG
jgi:NAD(P)-dependent dehydrogenase (short-subunit alcohol dehydrogenase family)